MRCPYCSEDIHDQAIKCPYCGNLLVDKPGWRRNRTDVEEPAADPEVRPLRRVDEGFAARPRGAGRLAVLGVLLLVAAGVVGGFLLGRTGDDAPPVEAAPAASAGPVELREVAAERLQEIRRLEELLVQETEPANATEARLRDALSSCESAVRMVVEREERVFDSPTLGQFIRLANLCLAPTGQTIQAGV